MRDSDGQRFKDAEKALRIRVPEGGFVIVRVDGKAFHTYTRRMTKPFDINLSKAMDAAMRGLVMRDLPATFAYTQSDEISVLIDQRTGQPWFDGQVQKIASVAASMATAHFNKTMYSMVPSSDAPALFDGRVFHLETKSEVWDYFKWRKADANRNAISMLAQSMFSHRELQGVNKAGMLDMIAAKDPDALPIGLRNFNGAYMHPIKVRRSSPIDGSPYLRTEWGMDVADPLGHLERSLDLREASLL